LLTVISIAAAILLPLLTVILAAAPALAIELWPRSAQVRGSFDTTISLAASMRTSDRDPRIIGRENGGLANSVNGDNGNLNYSQWDLTSASGKVTHELELESGDYAAFGRAFYFYDAVVMNRDTRTPITDRAKDEIGANFTLLDAYVRAHWDLAGLSTTLKVGNQVMSWGEGTFIQNGINTISPIDVSKLRVAGAELRDGLTAIPLVNLTVGLGSRFSLQGFYQFAWDHTEVEPEGTFFSTNDFASPGGNTVLLGFGEPGIGDNPPFGGANIPVGSAVPRQHDKDASDSGQFGLAFRWFEPKLADTEFGFYFTRLHSRLPVISATTGTAIGLANGNYAETARYFREFPEYINTYGFSFNTELGATGWALQGEVSYREDQPLQKDDVELLFAALTPVSPALFGQNQIGIFGFDEEITGYKRKDMIQAQLTVSTVLGPLLGADQMVFLAEGGVTHIQHMEDQDSLRYEASGTYTSGTQFFTDAGIQPETQINGFPDPTSWGYRLVLRGEYNNAIGPVGFIPQVAWAHDVTGTSPVPVANFVEKRMTISASLTATYLFAWRAKLSYTNSFGGNQSNSMNDRDDVFNLLTDRDFLSLSLSYSF
jgi:hypothetical protein